MTIAERVADTFTAGLDLQHLSKVDVWILHGIKSVSMHQWAKDTLANLRKGAR